MKLIDPSFTIENQTDFTLEGILKHIEKCAKVCYKSENNITDTSYKKFVETLINKGHDRPLEFGTVYLNLNILNLSDKDTKQYYDTLCAFYNNNPYSRNNDGFVTTNYRVIVENKRFDDLNNFLCWPTEHHDKRYTVHFILDRGTMDSFRTHVGLSHLAESTRYCNYSKDKFNNEITYIKPDWWDNASPVTRIETRATLDQCEHTYFTLIKWGMPPQDARMVLPLGIKSELISCGYKDAWQNFFYRRSAIDAHPMARLISLDLEKQMTNEFNK